jgi:N utilization substance protein A
MISVSASSVISSATATASAKAAAILQVSYDVFRDRAKVVVSQDQLPLAIGKAGQNVRLAARLTRYKIDVASEEQVREKRMRGAQELQQLIDAGLMDDYMRESFLDQHLDSLAVLAAQTPELLLQNLEEVQLTEEQARALNQKADELLTEEQRAEKDELVHRRIAEAAQAAAAEAAAIATAANAAAKEAAEAALHDVQQAEQG